jgi:hypothetical protein
MSRICACCDSARFGAVVRSDFTFERETFVDAAIVKRTSSMFLRPVHMTKPQNRRPHQYGEFPPMTALSRIRFLLDLLATLRFRCRWVGYDRKRKARLSLLPKKGIPAGESRSDKGRPSHHKLIGLLRRYKCHRLDFNSRTRIQKPSRESFADNNLVFRVHSTLREAYAITVPWHLLATWARFIALKYEAAAMDEAMDLPHSTAGSLPISCMILLITLTLILYEVPLTL